MPRERYQRGSLRKTGKRVKKWRGHWFIYRAKDGAEKRIPRSRVLGLVSEMSRGQAQTELDKLIQQETSQTPPPDAGITLAQLLNDVYLPIKERQWAANTRAAMTGTINRYVMPQLGGARLSDLGRCCRERLYSRAT